MWGKSALEINASCVNTSNVAVSVNLSQADSRLTRCASIRRGGMKKLGVKWNSSVLGIAVDWVGLIWGNGGKISFVRSLVIEGEGWV